MHEEEGYVTCICLNPVLMQCQGQSQSCVLGALLNFGATSVGLFPNKVPSLKKKFHKCIN